MVLKFEKSRYLQVDIDIGSEEIRDDIISNSPDGTGKFLDNFILVFDTENDPDKNDYVVFVSKDELIDAINITGVVSMCKYGEDFDDWAEFRDQYGNDVAITIASYFDKDFDGYFESLIDFIYEYLEEI